MLNPMEINHEPGHGGIEVNSLGTWGCTNSKHLQFMLGVLRGTEVQAESNGMGCDGKWGGGKI